MPASVHHRLHRLGLHPEIPFQNGRNCLTGQFSQHRCDRFGQSLGVVTSLQNQNQAAAAYSVRKGHQYPGQGGKSFRSYPHPAHGIQKMRVKTGRNQNHFRQVRFDHRYK